MKRGVWSWDDRGANSILGIYEYAKDEMVNLKKGVEKLQVLICYSNVVIIKLQFEICNFKVLNSNWIWVKNDNIIISISKVTN